MLQGLSPYDTLLIVAPTLAAATQLVAESLVPGRALLGVHKHTLDTLAAALAFQPLMELGVSRISGLGVEAVVSRVLSELSVERALGRFEEVAERPGFVRALARSVDEARAASVEAERLTHEDRDLARVLVRYERALGALALADRSEVLRLATARAHSARHPWLGHATLFLDVPITSQKEAHFVEAMLTRSPRSLATVVRGDDKSEACFTSADRACAKVLRLEPEDDRALSRLQVFLFRHATDAAPFAASELESVQLMSSPGESREAVEVARRVLEAARAGVAFDRMAIVLRSTDAYRAVLEEALLRAGIPAHFGDGLKRPDPAARALVLLLDCARDGLSARAFAEFLSLGMLRAPSRDASETDDALDDESPVFPRRWEKLLVDAAVIGGRVRWQRRLSGLRAQLTLEAEALEADDPRKAALCRDVAQLEALERFALPVLDALVTLPKGGTWGEWIASLDALARLAIREPEALCETLAELWPLAPVGPVSIDEVHRLLSRRLGDVIVRAKGHGAGKLWVGGIEDVRGRSFERVFVLGLAEKMFPARIVEDALLPDRVRRALGTDLSLTDERVLAERMKLHVAVGAARDAVVLSYPRFDVDHGRPRVPSFYALEVLRAVEGRLPALEELSRRAHPGAAARVGFPAPESPEQAIDDAEYDLAILGRLLCADSESRRGAARYLLSANRTLSRALRFRARRWAVRRFTAADGLVAESEASRGLLASEGLTSRAYSATALASFAECPYAFYLRAIVGLSPRGRARGQDELDARERGVLFHGVQRRVLEGMRGRGMLPLQVSRLEEALGLMRDELERAAAEVREACFPAIDRVFDDSVRAIGADLAEWLSRMTADARHVPAYFELGFGLSRSRERDAHSTDEPVALSVGLSLRGAIDLVERVDEGAGALVLRATDHKTGEPPEGKLGILSGGRMLQPVLYALALEALFPEAKVRSGRLYFCTSTAGFTEHEVLLDDRARAAAKDLTRAIDGALARSFLPAAPLTDACQRCAYTSVCGPYEAERVARHKPLEALLPLHHVRGLP